MDYVAAIERDAAATFELCSRDPARRITSCPEWTAKDLVEHLIETFEGTITGFGEGTGLPPEAALKRAVEVVVPGSDEAKAVAQECAIHRWDAAQAFDVEYSVDPELAVDSIPSFFIDAWPLLLDYLKRPAGTGQTVHLHRTDGEGEWLVTLDHRPVVTQEHARADVAVRGTASDLVLWLWGRMEPPEVHGDVSVLESIRNPHGRFLSPGF